MLPLEKIIEALVQAGRPEPEVRRLISEKQEELSGLVSPEGAAYIVARECGLNLLAESRRQLKVASLVPNLRSVDLLARVLRIFPAREFERNGKKGSVASAILADDTGSVRLSLWNDEIALLQDIHEGDTIRLAGGFTKQDYRGNPELRVGRGELSKSPVELPAQAAARSTERADIAELQEGPAEVRAALVAVAQRSPFYSVCPQCGGKLDAAEPGQGPGRVCKEHGAVEPEQRLRIAGTLDDGTGNIRAVFFREAAEQLAGKSTAELRAAAELPPLPALGKEFVVSGRVKQGLNGKLELVANRVAEVDAAAEARKLLA